jgi:L-gulonolactone oxidase
MEYSIERSAAVDAVQRVLELVRRRSLPILFPLEVRFSAPDDAMLSPAHGRPCAFIAVHQFAGMEFESYFRAVEQIMLDYGGRPHWGKRHYLDAPALASRYPDWQRFREIRDRYDPDRVFANDHLRRVLGE